MSKLWVYKRSEEARLIYESKLLEFENGLIDRETLDNATSIYKHVLLTISTNKKRVCVNTDKNQVREYILTDEEKAFKSGKVIKTRNSNSNRLFPMNK